MNIAVSLFSGCGGFCEGVELAGFKVKAAVELDTHAALTYRHNFPHVPLFEGDVADFLKAGDGHDKKYGLREVDLVFGGPPCQGYSQIGPRDLKDERNGLYKEFARIVEQLQPRLFMMENVPNLLLLNRGHFRDLILRKFASIGYTETVFVKVSADEFGVPQTRQRVIFVGIRDRDATSTPLEELCQAALSRLRTVKPVTVWEAIGDLPEIVVASGELTLYPKKGRLSSFQRAMRLDTEGTPYTRRQKQQRGHGDGAPLLHNHHTKEIQDRRRKLISLLAPGEKADSLPKHIWNGARPEKWRRLHPDQPSHTILAQMHRDLSEWVHPSLERWITVREAARLQSFHDGFVFKSSEWQQLKQIGNAVPPLLAHALGTMAGTVLDQLHTRKRNSERKALAGAKHLLAAE